MFGNFCCPHYYGWPEWMLRVRDQGHIGRQYWQPCRKLLAYRPRLTLRIGSIIVRVRWKRRLFKQALRRAM